MRHLFALAVVFAACNERSPTGAPDAATPDAAVPDAGPDPSRMPFTTTGSTPNGPFDVHYMTVGFYGGDCPEGYTISLYETNELVTAPALIVSIPAAEVTAPTGTISAVAMLWNASAQTPVAFEATHVDLPPTDPLRLAGRAVVNASPWQIDFSIDVLTMAAYCI